jgi:isoleucyl-tRNA synthetase
LHDFEPEKDAVAYEELPDLDRYMLHRITEVFTEIEDAFNQFHFFRFFQTVQNFCVVDLSNFYLDIAKDRLYISADNAFRRRSCQTVLAVALENLAKAIAPVLCHMAEDIWQNLPYATPYSSVFESGWVKLEDNWKQPELAKFWQKLREIRAEVNQVMEKARKEKMIGSSLEAKVLLYVSDDNFRKQLEQINPSTAELKQHNGVDQLRYLFICSQVELLETPNKLKGLEYSDESEDLGIGVVKADGEKCDRCWNYSVHVGESTEDPTICERCVAALAGEF